MFISSNVLLRRSKSAGPLNKIFRVVGGNGDTKDIFAQVLLKNHKFILGFR